MARWTRTSLLQACEEVLQRSTTVLRLQPVRAANTTAGFEGDIMTDGTIDNVVITVDTAQGGLIESVLHELLHVVLDQELNAKFNSLLEERMIKSLEQELFVKTINKGHLRRWRRLIKSKL